jgi:soluble lytic murein transglycosylase-like protein
MQTSSARHQALGAGLMLLTLVPAYWASRQSAPLAAPPPPPVSEPTAIAVEAVDETSPPRITRAAIRAHIDRTARRYGVPPSLVAAIVEAESAFNPRAVSRKGARGLMQLMPQTASSLDVEDVSDPFDNVDAGVRHLKRLLNRFDGNLPLALAAYNAGEQAVIAYGGIPPYPETRRYVTRVLRRMGRADLAPSTGDRGRLRVVQAALTTATASAAVPEQTVEDEEERRPLLADRLREFPRPQREPPQTQ